MAFVITDKCVGVKDAGCVSVCPSDCIAPRPHDPDFPAATQLYIDPHDCIDCGLCVDECPARAIFAESDLTGDDRRFIALNAAHFKRQP
ncbi:MAG: 4Fe-4S dicluster domain-containing protein [Planctomycetes bacterium]|nr:4Fe-4S dicluster domain-containing protein [Planctomycetota bacterium]